MNSTLHDHREPCLRAYPPVQHVTITAQSGYQTHSGYVGPITRTTGPCLGLGIISQPVMSPEGELTLFPSGEPQAGAGASAGRIGLAVSLSCPPGGGQGLLVVGNCLDPEQVVPLAGVVAVIGGNSAFADDLQETGEPEAGGVVPGKQS